MARASCKTKGSFIHAANIIYSDLKKTKKNIGSLQDFVGQNKKILILAYKFLEEPMFFLLLEIGKWDKSAEVHCTPPHVWKFWKRELWVLLPTIAPPLHSSGQVPVSTIQISILIYIITQVSLKCCMQLMHQQQMTLTWYSNCETPYQLYRLLVMMFRKCIFTHWFVMFERLSPQGEEMGSLLLKDLVATRGEVPLQVVASPHHKGHK